ncbi:hypothetical protein [Pseudoxanthomonas sp. SE1]|uniref:hypothetical protein n=1 Tax=Pseudoxanthomonas sp. SE1 TaxID=1664560 RepID=UPI00240DF715|nr:hypothetical protein [Pseudoxanthomonas sp. SE1]WFC42288.1 hypothetical protein OY559_01730 [Pseudoxanthomonas sp. SE1]
MSQPALTPEFEAELTALMAKHGLTGEDAQHLLRRMAVIIGVRQVAAELGRPLDRKERKSAYVRIERGEAVSAVAGLFRP